MNSIGFDSTRILIIGLGYGDEGKGTIIDALCRRKLRKLSTKATVIRFNGGPQAAHHVVAAGVPERTHCFAQFGSGMLVPDVWTLLSAYMLIEPLALLAEAEALINVGVVAPLRRLIIDRQCVVVTPFHRLLNRMQELARGPKRHGSCGLGVGQAWLDSRSTGRPTLHIGDAQDDVALRKQLRFIQLCKIDLAEQIVEAHAKDEALHRELGQILDQLRRSDWIERLSQAYSLLLREIAELDNGTVLQQTLTDKKNPVLFEGAQGVLLDAERGFFPYVTPSRTTFDNALELLHNAQTAATPLRLGVLRAYGTRHGPGPFVSHDADLEQRLPELHNGQNPWQGAMRIGWLDAVAARYALAISGGVTALALTGLDRLAGLSVVRVCTAYRLPNGTTLEHLPVSPSPSREQQIELTQLLRTAEPIYTELAGFTTSRDGPELSAGALNFVRFLESPSGIGIPIAVASTGPTAKDKIFRWDL